jgi:hypothetical protein
MIWASIFFAIAVAVTAALLNRWKGSTDSHAPIKSAAWAIFWGIGTTSVVALPWFYVFPLVTLPCFLGQTVGRGGPLRMGRDPVKQPGTERGVEVLEWPQYLIFYKNGKRRWISQYAYDFLLMALKGLAMVSGVVIAFAIFDPVAALKMALAGPAMSLGYELGWRLFPTGSGRRFLGMTEATQIGEAFGAGFAGLLYLWAVL